MGPLAGLRIIEIESIGPGPFCAMMLADMGAEVLRIERPAALRRVGRDPKFDFLRRGRCSVQADLKSPRARQDILHLVERADGLLEGFRPGVMERLGLGPEACLAVNPRLVYGRMTGWGQTGPMADRAGHDLNYIALSGLLHCIGRPEERPVPPLNLLGDFGGGGMYLAFGMVCALLECVRSGKGQIVDAAILDGTISLGTYIYGLRAGGYWSDQRGDNNVDGGAPWYDVYETSDGRYVAIAAIEEQFYAALIDRLDLAQAGLPAQHDKSGWPALRRVFARAFASRTRDEWCEAFAGVDACFAPVLSIAEADQHEQVRARNGFVTIDGLPQPAPAPRFSRTDPDVPVSGKASEGGLAAILAAWRGVTANR